MSDKIYPPLGKIQRFKGASNKGKSGFDISLGPYGIKGDWATGEKETYYEGERPSKRTRKIISQRVKEEKQVSEKTAAEECHDIWIHSIECYTHPYLEKKQVDSFDLRLQIFEDKPLHYDKLIIPLHDIHDQIWSIQYIDFYGEKKFHPNGRKKGNFYLMGNINDPWVICEGYATGASIAMAAKVCVIVALDGGNLYPVAQQFKSMEPNRQIYIASDDDKWKPEIGNAGQYYAEICRQKLNCKIIVPSFKDEATKPKDFNDLHVLEGLGAVYDRVMEVLSTGDMR